MIVYCVWAGDQYYPTGPGDLKGIFETREEAQQLINKLNEEYEYGFRKRWDWVEITKETVQSEKYQDEENIDDEDE
jgi:hypothetical protein